VDRVAPGEQQPESDHGFASERTEAGVFRDRHYRHATGWFSYNLRNPKAEARALRVTYFGGDQGRTFSIFLNGQLLQKVTSDASKGSAFFDVEYPLPAALRTGSASQVERYPLGRNIGQTDNGDEGLGQLVSTCKCFAGQGCFGGVASAPIDGQQGIPNFQLGQTIYSLH
nr:hypothetical protein [Tanacetum cinerariifolium]